MKKQNIIFISIAIIVLIAVFTNPNVQAHREALKMMFNQSLLKQQETNGNEDINITENNESKLGAILGNVFIDEIIKNIVTTDNYILFSITKLSFEGENRIIGYGLFGNVFISSEFNKVLKNDFENNKAFEEKKKNAKEEAKKDLEELRGL